MTLNWPTQLLADLARRRAVLFLGSGVSANSVGNGGARPPVWEKFLRGAAAKIHRPAHVMDAIERKDYLLACEIIKHRLDDEWVPYLRKCYVDPEYKKAEIHDLIYNLDAQIVITPNFDKIYDNYAQNESSNTIQIKTYQDEDLGDAVRGVNPLILKIHGTIDNPSSMIFSWNEYVNARAKFSASYNLIDALLLTRTFLFIGAGINDPDIKMLLERVAGLYPRTLPHYMLIQKGNHKDVSEAIRKNLKIKFIEYNVDENHLALLAALRELLEVLEIERTDLYEKQAW